MQIKRLFCLLVFVNCIVVGAGAFAAVPESDTNYLKLLEQRAMANWRCSSTDPKPVAVGFFVADDGKIYNARIKQSSGDNQTDAECLEAVCSLAPLELNPGRRITGDLTQVELTFQKVASEPISNNVEVANFFKKHADLRSRFIAIHLIPTNLLKRAANGLTPDQVDSENNLRLIPVGESTENKSENQLSKIHSYSGSLKEVYARWAAFLSENPKPTKLQILRQAADIERDSLPAQPHSLPPVFKNLGNAER
jgi:hypothetical protein